MHYIVFGVNFQIPFVSFASLVFLFSSSSACQPIFLIIPILIIHHSFTLSPRQIHIVIS